MTNFQILTICMMLEKNFDLIWDSISQLEIKLGLQLFDIQIHLLTII